MFSESDFYVSKFGDSVALCGGAYYVNDLASLWLILAVFDPNSFQGLRVYNDLDILQVKILFNF